MKNSFEIQNLKINTCGVNNKTILDIPYYHQENVRELLVTGGKGAGKTTFLYAIAGLFLKLNGKVKWNGKSIYDMAPSERDAWSNNRVGFVYQSYQLNDEISVLDNILLPTGFDSIICPEPLMQKAEQLADKFGVSIFSSINKLQPVQKQYIAIARALINDAELVIADDLTAGLDIVAATTLLNHLREECRLGNKSLVIASDKKIVKAHMPTEIKLEQGRLLLAHDEMSEQLHIA